MSAGREGSEQGHLWQTFRKPLLRSRSSDPQSSVTAAIRAAPRAGSQAAHILEALRRSEEPRTAEQLAAITGIDPYVVRKRLPDPLERRGWVRAVNRETMAAGDVLRWERVK